MSTFLRRVCGAALALIGLAAAVVGGWFLATLGTSGTATFTADPDTRVVVLDPDVINRVDAPVEVTATGDGTLWAGVARPSDAEAFLGDTERSETAGVVLDDWTLSTTTVGQGEPVEAHALDIWDSSQNGDGTLTATIDQAEAPQTLVISAPEREEIEAIELSVTHQRWGTTAVAVLAGGVLAFLVGIALMVRRGRRTQRYTPRRGRPRRGAARGAPAPARPARRAREEVRA